MTSLSPAPSGALLTALNSDLISVNLEVSSRKKLLEEMARLLTIPLHEETREKDIYHQLWEREKLGNTGIGNGVALPHSRCEQADNAVVAIITLAEGIDYDSIDRQPVDVAFGLLVPQEASQEHLSMLADIARMMSDTEHKKELAQAKNAEHVIQLIESWTNQQ